MKLTGLLTRGSVLSPPVAALAYGCIIMLLAASAFLSGKRLFEQQASVDNLTELMSRLQGRGPAASRGGTVDTGSFFLEGGSVTIAGAALLQKIVGTVTRHGGNVLSSQLDMQGAAARDGLLTVVLSCELDQPALQKVIYDIEAGTPFLFIEQLDVQAGSSSVDASDKRLRVLLSVSGQWRSDK